MYHPLPVFSPPTRLPVAHILQSKLGHRLFRRSGRGRDSPGDVPATLDRCRGSHKLFLSQWPPAAGCAEEATGSSFCNDRRRAVGLFFIPDVSSRALARPEPDVRLLVSNGDGLDHLRGRKCCVDVEGLQYLPGGPRWRKPRQVVDCRLDGKCPPDLVATRLCSRWPGYPPSVDNHGSRDFPCSQPRPQPQSRTFSRFRSSGSSKCGPASLWQCYSPRGWRITYPEVGRARVFHLGPRSSPCLTQPVSSRSPPMVMNE